MADPGGHTEMNDALTRFITAQNPHKINLYCFNAPDVIAYAHSPRGGVAQSKHYNIGYGYWELSRFPAEWREQFRYLDELWAPSTYIRDVLTQSTTLPVMYMPIPVDFSVPTGYTRADFNLLDDKFLFVFTFDLSSHMARKNPQAVIQAFAKAFPSHRRENVGLVIKITSLRSQPEHFTRRRELLAQIAFDSRITLIDQTFDRTSSLGLIQVCDAYVSLHRSEGFGLGMAEAMKMGKLVIATHYSGNKDFMNRTNSCPVSYDLVKVDKSEYWFVEDGAEWAEPDIDHASYYMRHAYEDQAWAATIGQMAKRYIDDHHSAHVIGLKYQKRISEILKLQDASTSRAAADA
jgi:glycosyltransferase involved in cell wall biosynthesis